MILRLSAACLAALSLSACAFGQDRARVFDSSSWTEVFDGKSLEGWTPTGGRYDGRADWKVENGMIVGREGPRKAGGLLYTKGYYQSYLLTLEVQIDEPFDSGVFVHMVPRNPKRAKGVNATKRAPRAGDRGLQMTLDARPGGEIGGIYADGWLQHQKDGWTHWKKNEWNLVEMRVRGAPTRVETWLNGEKLSVYEMPAKIAQAFAPSGRIGIQVHGGRQDGPRAARFRNIRIHELPTHDRDDFVSDDKGQLRARPGTGWRKLFDGASLDGWKLHGNVREEGFRAKDGILSFPKDGGDGALVSAETYQDFELRLDFKIARMANSGLYLRSLLKGNLSFNGAEVQILDDFNWETVTKSKLKDYQFCGGLYGAVAASDGDCVLNPLGRWNSYRVRYVGSQLRVELNGRLLYDVDTHALQPKQGKPFAQRAKRGHIGLQRHAPAQFKGDAYAWFKNIYIRPIENGAEAGAKKKDGRDR